MKSLSALYLEKSYKGRKVVDNVSIEVKEGEIVGLLGPNGAGKSTSFYIIVGRIKPEAGNVIMGTKDVTAMPMYKRARLGLGYLPQEASVFRSLTVSDNLRIVLQENGYAKAEAKDIIEHLIEEFNLGRIAGVPGYALSGGERRRVEIARALAIAPSFLLLDEPFSGIDPIAVYDIQQIIVSLRSKGYGILLTDHNVRETLAITDRAYLIHQGKVVIEGPPSEVAESEVARKFYLGDRFSFI